MSPLLIMVERPGYINPAGKLEGNNRTLNTTWTQGCGNNGISSSSKSSNISISSKTS